MLIQYPGGPEELKTVPNTDDQTLFDQALQGLRRGLPELQYRQARPEPAVICGGGPSLTDEESLATIRELQRLGGVVIALNNSARTLLQHGIRPSYQIVLDARGINASFVDEDVADELLLASHCHPETFDAALAAGRKITVFSHCTPKTLDKLAAELGRTETPLAVGGSHTVGLVALCVSHVLGHDLMHLFGYDSCHRDGASHAYEQKVNANDELLDVIVHGGRHFTASLAMVSQARAFPDIAQALTDAGCEIHVHGDGLLPCIAKMIQEGQESKPLTAVYDLATGPATWEFLTFLAEAERYRVDHGHTCIDIIFVPGPGHGFRMDFLPPSVEERAGMLQRVLIPATRLLASVRNVAILKEKTEAIPEGPLFPPYWTPERAVSCYGPEHLHEGNRVLRATPVARRWREKNYPERYVTITIREADYWLARNSNKAAWCQAAEWLAAQGYRVVFVPDTYGTPIDGFENCAAAAWDIDLRLALYEGAVLNLGVSNGPMALCYLSDAPYLIFGLIGKESPITEAFYQRREIPIGSQWGPNGKNVWEEDSPEAIMRELKAHFMKDSPQEAAA